MICASRHPVEALVTAATTQASHAAAYVWGYHVAALGQRTPPRGGETFNCPLPTQPKSPRIRKLLTPFETLCNQTLALSRRDRR